MRKILVFLALLLCFISAYAEGGDASVRGVVIDRDTKETLPMATVQLYMGYESKPLKGTTTDTAGFFKFTNLQYGNYRLEISFVGYEMRSVLFSLSYAEYNVNLHRIRLTPEEAMLQELTVVGQQTNMKVDIDKKVFIVNDNAHTEGIMASEMLKDLPSVDIDAEGTVTLRNKEAVEIYINGKPATMGTDNQGDLLDQIPAESIQKVELITNPSAKYNAEGSAGIINIILKEKRDLGLFGSVSGGLSFPCHSNMGGSLSSTVNYSTKKVDLTATAGYNRRNNFTDGYTHRRTFGTDTSYLSQNNQREFKMNSGFVRLGADYKINYKSNLSASGYASLSNRKSEIENLYSRGIKMNGLTNELLHQSRLSNQDGDMRSLGASLDYIYRLDKDGEEISAALAYSGFFSDNTTNIQQTSTTAANATTNSEEKQESDNGVNNFSVQLDYVNPISLVSKIEIGYKSNFQRTENVSNYFAEPANIAILSNDFYLQQNVHALYGIYGTKAGKTSFKVGLRGELTEVSWEQKTEQQKEARDPYLDLFPSLYLGYKLTPTIELQLNYTRRINRPRSWQINPFHNMTDSANIRYGNPMLDPEYINSVEFNLLKTFDKHTISASVYYNQTKDVIQRYNWINGNSMMQTFANISRSHSGGLEVVLKDKFKYVSLTTSANLYGYKLDGGHFTVSGVDVNIDEKSSFCWIGKTMADIILPWSLKGQISANYNSARATAQGKTLSTYQVNAGLKRQFFDRKLTAAFSVKDIFDSRKRRNETWDDNFSQESETHRHGRTFNINLTYIFGKQGKEKKEKAKESDTEDFEEEM